MTIEEALNYLENWGFSIEHSAMDTGFGPIEAWYCKKGAKEITLYDCDTNKKLIRFNLFSNNEWLTYISEQEFIEKVNS